MEPHHVAVASVIAGWFIVGVAMVIGRRPSRVARVRQRSVAGLAGLALQGAGFALVFGWRRIGIDAAPIGWPAAAVSAALNLGSATFMFFAVRTLGKQWSLLPRLLEEHALIEEGPYSVVRHPIYTAMLGLLVATGVALERSSVVALAAALYVAGTVIRIRLEERLLNQVVGRRYSEYSRRVPAFLPFPLRRRDSAHD